MTTRPPCIVSTHEVDEHTHVYPGSTEPMGPVRRIGKAARLERIGVNIQRLPPGRRSSWPHAEEDEEKFVYVLQGTVDAWINGHLHAMRPGDIAAFPAGTGVAHCFVNNSTEDVVLLVGGEAPKAGSRIHYPLHPSRRDDMPPANWWEDVPKHELGPDDALGDVSRDGHAPTAAQPYEITSDKRRMSVAAAHAFLTRAYWSAGIPLATVQKAFDNSLCFAALLAGEQVGFARVVTDKATFAYLADVHVLEAHRGHGLARRLVEAVQAHPDLQGLRRFMLATRDAHALYARFGFVPIAVPDRFMERHDPDAYAQAKRGAM